MHRPTLVDVAGEAGVSISTVNRVLGGSAAVRARTVKRVRAAAEAIGYLDRNLPGGVRRASGARCRLGLLVQRSGREVYPLVGKTFEDTARTWPGDKVDPLVAYVEQVDPETTAVRLRELADDCDAIALIAADDPLVGNEINALRDAGKPVVAYMTDQSAGGRAGYVGADNWVLGRTAAWFVAQTTARPGRVQVLVGNHRYQHEELSEAGFRSYLRERATGLTVSDVRATLDDPGEAYRIATELLAGDEDLVSVYAAGGCNSGLLMALREVPESRRRGLCVICRDTGPETRRALAEGLITVGLSLPLEAATQQLILTMLDAIRQPSSGAILRRTTSFEIVAPENP